MNHFVETYDPTIEDSYRKQIHVDNTPSILEILDTAGQEEYTAMREQWIRDAQGFMLVYSIASRATFEGLRKLVEQIIRVKELDIQNIPLVLVGNKADMTSHREVSAADAALLARVLGCECIETSAKTRINVETAFYKLVDVMRRSRGEGLSPIETQRTGGSSQASLAHRDGSRTATEHRNSGQKSKKKCIIM